MIFLDQGKSEGPLEKIENNGRGLSGGAVFYALKVGANHALD
jgi:hypothetical protein